MFKSSMHTPTKNNIGLAVFLLLLCQSAFAYPELLGVRAQSLGEAYRAVASANDILLYNPAGLINNRHLGVDADYFFATNPRLHSLTVSVVDSETTAWGMGLAYNASISAQTSIPTTHMAYLGMAMPLGTDQVALGAGVSYLYDPHHQDDSYSHYFNMDVGLLAELGAGLRIAVVVDHLLSPKGKEKPLGFSIGSAFALGDILEAIPLTASFDWSMKEVASDGDLHHVLGLGFEYFAYQTVPLRIGYKTDLRDQRHLLSIGSGVVVNSFAVDGLYQQNLAVGKSRFFGLAVRINI